MSIIVAAAENGVIGRANALPWQISEDLKYFKKVTMGKPIVMGRKTYESIGRPLPGRTNIVITRNTGWQAEGVVAVATLPEAIAAAERQSASDGVDELFVIGGEQIYRLAESVADRVYMTSVHAEVEGDAYFPPLSADRWQQVSCQLGTDTAALRYSFLVFERC